MKGIARLPFRTKKQVYDAYVAEMLRRREPVLHSTTFYKVWRDRCNRIKTCRKKDNFSICGTCAARANELSGAVTVADANIIKARWNAHLLIMRRNRNKYHKHAEKAVSEPRRYTSIIIDGGDKRKIALPAAPGPRLPSNVANIHQVSVSPTCVN